jgi:hypothetical protein
MSDRTSLLLTVILLKHRFSFHAVAHYDFRPKTKQPLQQLQPLPPQPLPPPLQ